jgi:hypothetical protein
MAEQTDPQTACSNKIMDLMMPAMSAYFCFIMPALVGIYWIFKSLISTLRQFIVCKIMPYPQFTEEDYKAAEREMAGKAPKKGATTQRGAYSYPASTKTVDGRPIYPISQLEGFCKINKVLMGIITVPAEHAQSVCDQLIACGIKAIWTFAPTHLEVPEHILVQYENMATSLAVLSMHLQAQIKEKK